MTAMSRDLIKDNYNALIETGSLLGHDLSGQYHVIQFCLDELATRPLDEQTRRFIERIGQSLDELIRLTEGARRVFRDSSLPQGEFQDTLSLGDVIELACGHYYVHAAKSFPAIESQVSGAKDVGVSSWEQLFWFMIAPTLMARVQLGAKNGNSELVKFAIESASEDSSAWTVKFEVGDLALLGDLDDPSAFLGEREKRFCWGSKLLSDSLLGNIPVKCSKSAFGLTFSNR